MADNTTRIGYAITRHPWHTVSRNRQTWTDFVSERKPYGTLYYIMFKGHYILSLNYLDCRKKWAMGRRRRGMKIWRRGQITG